METGFPKGSCSIKKLKRQSFQFETIALGSMIRKSGNRFSEKIMLDQKAEASIVSIRNDCAWEHDPEKWKPVFRKDHARSKS